MSILSSLQLALRYPTPQSCCIKKLLFSIWLKSVDKTVKIYKENEGAGRFSVLWVMTHFIKPFCTWNAISAEWQLLPVYFNWADLFHQILYSIIHIDLTEYSDYQKNIGIHVHFYSWPFCPSSSDNLICNKNFWISRI